MKMTVFNADSPGVPTEKPKGNIQLIQVGEQYSIAHIDKMVNEIDPIRVGDIVYSPAWSPEEPMRFALIGKIDVNRDGKDDRQDLKRMIEEAGGIVDYDLPPPDHGKESGKLTARISWYVTDERMPLREVFEARTDAGVAAQAQFDKRFGQAIKEARAEGIRPMPLGRLLAYFGYEMGTPVVGRTEAVNSAAMLRLVQPRKKAAEPKIETDSSKAGAEPANAKPEAEAAKPAKPEPEAAKPEEDQVLEQVQANGIGPEHSPLTPHTAPRNRDGSGGFALVRWRTQPAGESRSIQGEMMIEMLDQAGRLSSCRQSSGALPRTLPVTKKIPCRRSAGDRAAPCDEPNPRPGSCPAQASPRGEGPRLPPRCADSLAGRFQLVHCVAESTASSWFF